MVIANGPCNTALQKKTQNQSVEKKRFPHFPPSAPLDESVENGAFPHFCFRFFFPRRWGGVRGEHGSYLLKTKINNFVNSGWLMFMASCNQFDPILRSSGSWEFICSGNLDVPLQTVFQAPKPSENEAPDSPKIDQKWFKRVSDRACPCSRPLLLQWPRSSFQKC